MLNFLNTDPFLVLFGCMYLIVGASIFLKPVAWKEFCNLYIRSEPICLITGVVMLPLALYVVVFYNNWNGISSILLMGLAYWALIEAIVLLLRPSLIQNLLAEDKFILKPFWLHGVVSIVIGAALLVL